MLTSLLRHLWRLRLASVTLSPGLNLSRGKSKLGNDIMNLGDTKLDEITKYRGKTRHSLFLRFSATLCQITFNIFWLSCEQNQSCFIDWSKSWFAITRAICNSLLQGSLSWGVNRQYSEKAWLIRINLNPLGQVYHLMVNSTSCKYRMNLFDSQTQTSPINTPYNSLFKVRTLWSKLFSLQILLTSLSNLSIIV